MEILKKILGTIEECQKNCNALEISPSNRHCWYQEFTSLVENESSIPLKVMKQSRWDLDSVIFYLPKSSLNSFAIVIKVHDEIFPIASNILSNNELIKKMASCRFVPNILTTKLLSNTSSISQRVVIYEYIHGVDAYLYLQKNKDHTEHVNAALELCIQGLLDIGIHPYLKDLSDFIITDENNGAINVALVDMNAAIDVTNASSESRIGIMLFLKKIVSRFTDTQKKPYQGVMETLK